MRHKSIVSSEFMERQSERLGFEIRETEEMEDLILGSLYYFKRRGLFPRFFLYKPKLFWINKFVCTKSQGNSR